MSRTYVSLRVMSNTMLPSRIGEKLGMCPDKAWAKGARRGGTQILEKENGWEIQSGGTTERSIAEHVALLLERAAPLIVPLRGIAESVEVQVSCVVYAEAIPAINLSRALVEQLAALGASVDVDVYVESGASA